jgi:hypothetical protein
LTPGYVEDFGPSTTTQAVAAIRSDEEDAEGDPVTLGILSRDAQTGACRWSYFDRARAPEAAGREAQDVEEVITGIGADEELAQALRDLDQKYCGDG